MKVNLIFALSLFTLACVSKPPQSDLEKVFKRIPDGEYAQLIEKYSQTEKKYDGFYNSYEVSSTILNSKVQEALLQREGYFMQWEASKARDEREKAFQEMSSGTQVFVSLFTPERQHNDLQKASSMWKIYLESNGLRYKGSIKKFDKNLVQTANLFPYHTRFNKGYIVSFDIPMASIEKNANIVIMTSSLGSTTFKFLGM